MDDVAEIYMDSPPKTGFWKKNQRIWNANADIGEVLGWVNIREGMSAYAWKPLTSYTVNDLITPIENNGHYYKCIQTGYSGVLEPIFPLSQDEEIEDTRGGVTWQPSVNREINDIVFPTFSNNRFYICTVAGASGSSEPNWSLIDGGTTVDGDAIWTGYRICIWKEEGISTEFRPFGEIG